MKSTFAASAIGVGACLLIAASAALGYEVAFQVNPTEVVNDNGVRKCSATRSSTSHGNPGKGASRGTVFSTIGSACGIPDDKAPGNLEVKHQYMKKSNTTGNWGVCWGSGWKNNNDRTWTLAHYREWLSQPCGGGVYRTLSTGKVFINGSWHGENVIVNSGNHQV
ncbi:MAG: hypothetical protein ACRDMA_00310 [Solirubrobacterales bacterium]